MKKLLAICAALLMAIAIPAQEKDSVPPLVRDTAWKIHGFFGINTSQTALSNWQGGGQNNVNLGTILDFEALYKRDQFEQWDNKVSAQFGLIRNDASRLFKKNMDQLFALSKYNTRAFGKFWYYAIQADYRTQFAPGYNYSGDSIVGRAVSDINSPGYIQLALGLDYKPVDYFSVTFLPLAGKMTVVNRQYLADEGAFGVKKAELDANGNVVKHGERRRLELGGRVVIKFKKDIVKNVNLDSYLDLFSNYQHKFGNIDVVFNNLLTMKITKYFTVNVISNILYDDDVKTKYDWNKDGKYDNPHDIDGPRMQFLTTIAIGFGYKF